MRTLEQLIRYTTWFGAVSDAIIPLYILLVFVTFSLWLFLSTFLRKHDHTPQFGNGAYSDRDVFPASNPRSDPDISPTIHAHEASNATVLPLHVSNIASSTSTMKIWILRFLAVMFSTILWVLVKEVTPRLKWCMFPSLSITILLYIVQWMQSCVHFTRSPGNWLSFAIHRCHKLCPRVQPFIRCVLQNWVPARRCFYVQCGVGVLICGFVVYVFLTNEPLTRPVPSVGLPRKMCPSGSPSRPFEEVLRDYIAFHNDMWKRPVDQHRILLYHTTNEGLGNRIEGLVSAFVLAVVTDRAFMVDWSADSKCNAELRDLFGNPGFNWEVDWNVVRWEESKRESFYYAYCRACPIRTRNEEVTNTWESLLCRPNAGFDPHTRVVSILSTQWFAPVMAMNPHLRTKICNLFGADMWGAVAPHLLKLNTELQNRMNSFKINHGWTKDAEVISLQIRRLEGFGISVNVADAFLRCASAITTHTDTAKYFIATDHIPTRERFKEIIGDRLIHIDSKFDRESKRGIQDAVLEMYLLGEATNMIMSPYSTFGDISHARTSLIPYKVSRNGQCTKQLTSHPCFFYYFGMFDLRCFNSDMVLAELTNQEDCYN